MIVLCYVNLMLSSSLVNSHVNGSLEGGKDVFIALKLINLSPHYLSSPKLVLSVPGTCSKKLSLWAEAEFTLPNIVSLGKPSKNIFRFCSLKPKAVAQYIGTLESVRGIQY